jgi:hypothetical protein
MPVPFWPAIRAAMPDPIGAKINHGILAMTNSVAAQSANIARKSWVEPVLIRSDVRDTEGGPLTNTIESNTPAGHPSS